MNAVADLTDDVTGRVENAVAGVIKNRLISGRTLRAAATTFAVKAAVNYMTNRLSAPRALNDEHSRTKVAGSPFNKPDTNFQPLSTSAAVVED